MLNEYPKSTARAEELLGTVVMVRGEQLFGPQHAERLEELGAYLVLSAVAACRRREHHAKPLPVALHRKQAVVLSSGCAVACITVPTVASLRSHSATPRAHLSRRRDRLPSLQWKQGRRAQPPTGGEDDASPYCGVPGRLAVSVAAG